MKLRGIRRRYSVSLFEPPPDVFPVSSDICLPQFDASLSPREDPSKFVSHDSASTVTCSLPSSLLMWLLVLWMIVIVLCWILWALVLHPLVLFPPLIVVLVLFRLLPWPPLRWLMVVSR